MMARRFWSESELRLLSARYPSVPTNTIALALDRDARAVYAKANSLGLRKSEEFLLAAWRALKGKSRPGAEKGWFKKGQTPANKGLRRPGWSPGRMGETQFRKGQRTGMAAKNWRPIGTILADTEGYLRIKVREAVHGKEATGFGNTKVWPLYSRHIWEQHKSPIPPKHIIRFKDGNRANCAIENLKLISMRENRLRNSMWALYPPELAKAMQLNGALKNKLRRLNAKEK